jgi:hypothetical protein
VGERAWGEWKDLGGFECVVRKAGGGVGGVKAWEDVVLGKRGSSDDSEEDAVRGERRGGSGLPHGEACCAARWAEVGRFPLTLRSRPLCKLE